MKVTNGNNCDVDVEEDFDNNVILITERSSNRKSPYLFVRFSVNPLKPKLI